MNTNLIVCVCSEGEDPFETWWMLEQDDFERLLTNPPDVGRSALQWDESLVGKELIMYWNAPHKEWYHGKITAYNSSSMQHTIVWLEDDDDDDSVVNLLSCKMCSEWRLVQADEDIRKQLARLRALPTA